MTKNNYFVINRKLLPIKIHYFLFNLGISTINGFLSVIARQKGLSSAAVGILLTILSLLATVLKPVFGLLADRFNIHKFIFIVMQGIAALAFFSIYFIPSIKNNVMVNSNANNTELSFCPKNSIWDKCLEKRIQLHETKIFKCHLSCKPESWMQENVCMNRDDGDCFSSFGTFHYDITIDMNTIQYNSSCLILKDFKNISSDNSSIFFNNAPLYAKLYETNCEAICDDDFLKGTLANRGAVPDNEIIQMYQFWLFCILILTGESAISVVSSIGDTICFDLLGEDSHLYGRQRLWDSIGGGFGPFLAGAIIDTISGSSVFKDYTIVYFICPIALCINMMNSMKLEYIQQKKSENILKDVGKLLKSFKIFTFFCWCCFGGFFSAVIFNFVFWHLEELTDKIGQDECGANYVKTLEGIDVLFQCIIGEIPLFFWSGYILKKVGHVNCMHLIFAAFAARFFYYSQLWNPWWVLPIETLNGVTFGLLFSAMLSYTNSIAPTGTEATLQGVVGALFEGVGISSGNFVAGILFRIVGGVNTFLIFGVISICAMAIHILIHKILLLTKTKSRNISNKNVVNRQI